MQENMTIVRSALYVDFDNVYLGLQQTDAAAAEQFATNPARWLSRLESGGVRDGHEYRRRFLIRVCYLNPTSFARYRGDFTRAGFRVVDCPSLTRQGKSGADIQLALDVVDFTPLMVRLRSHDRRTVMVAASPVSSAYEAMCDDVLGPAELADAALEPTVTALAKPAPATPARDADQSLSGSPALARTEADRSDVASAVSAILAAVAASPVPVPGASAAHLARAAAPRLAATRWGGEGFLAFCKASLPPEITVISSVTGGGYLLDPSRHATDSIPEMRDQGDGIVARVCRLTGAPRLAPEQFRVFFEALADELAGNNFSLTVTSRNVRDATAERGQPLGRGPINFILQGLAYRAQGDMRAGESTPRALAESWRENVVDLCGNAGVDLGPEELEAIDAWILGEIPDPPRAAPPDPRADS